MVPLIIITILIGGIAGWLASLIYKGKGSGLILNIILGIVGAYIGDRLFKFFGFYASNDFIPSIITATVGAIIVLWIVNKLS